MSTRTSLIEEGKWGIPPSILANSVETYKEMSQFLNQPEWCMTSNKNIATRKSELSSPFFLVGR